MGIGGMRGGGGGHGVPPGGLGENRWSYRSMPGGSQFTSRAPNQLGDFCSVDICYFWCPLHDSHS